MKSKTVLVLVFMLLTCKMIAKADSVDPVLESADFSGRFIPYILAGYERFRLDQEDSSIQNFDVYVDQEDKLISVTFIPKLTPKELRDREELAGDGVVFLRHNPQNKYGRSVTYYFPVDNVELVRTVYP